MKILLTGATGYIGKRLLPVLVAKGYHVVCCTRDINRFNPPNLLKPFIDVVEVDFIDDSSINKIPLDIDGAYYLMHSMSGNENFNEAELTCARNFRNALNNTAARHVVYLSGIVNEHTLSKHLSSRKAVEDELALGDYSFTALRAGIIIGSGSASFEIIRDLVEKLPIMVTPKWLNTRCQPIGIHDVLQFLEKTMLNEKTFNKRFDIGGPDILTYKQMLIKYGEARGIKRYIYTLPVMTPRLSSYWLYFITSTSYKLAVALVNSMKIEVVCKNNELEKLLSITTLGYDEALKRTFEKLENNQIISSWKDSLISGRFKNQLSEFLQVPVYGCFIDKREKEMQNYASTLERIWRIGGDTGWYAYNFLWRLRGFIDKLFGGVGLRRGRTQPEHLHAGDTVDFWRVLYANKDEGRLLLFAEMKLPGEAWLEFRISGNRLLQTATFRPKGLNGRIYWYLSLPFHHFIFKGLISKLS